ncbi:hypothetical protein NQD34_012330, partial [Periophthalmus magnuspinnatus]
MPLHKSSRASRLDPTMISAPLGDFRHTMHIGRGGDTFGDTSFLSTIGPSPSVSETVNSEMSPPPPTNEPVVNVDHVDINESLLSESVSSFTLDLDLDLGPSMLGDVLGVMDGLGLEAFSPTSSVSPVEINQPNGAMERPMDLRNELNGKSLDENGVVGDSRIPDGNSFRAKALRPKVRFSDKREEIIRQASEEEEGQGFNFQDEDEMECISPTKVNSERERGVVMGRTDVELPPSPASSHS